MDVETGRKVINFRRGQEPLDLTGAIVMLGFEFVGDGTSKIIDSADKSVVIESARTGVCSVMLPNHLYNYSGRVLVHVYITFDDGRSLDAGVIVTEFEESWLDQELVEMENFYVKRFEDLADELRQKAEKIRQQMLLNAQKALNEFQHRIETVEDFRGPQGLQGERGIQGEQGEQGVAGTVGTISGSFDTLESLQEYRPTGKQGDMYIIGSDLYVWDVEREKWSNVGQIQGPQGLQGEQGVQGSQGIQGEQGARGERGETGSQGERGVDGPRGDQGIQGVQGPQGIQGERGLQGLQGEPGTTSWNGITDRPGTFPSTIQQVQGLQAHIDDNTRHVTQTERESWDSRLEREEFEVFRDKVFEESPLLHHIEQDTTIENTRDGKLVERSFEGRTMVNLWSDDRADFVNLNNDVQLIGNGRLRFERLNNSGGTLRTIPLSSAIFRANQTYTIMISNVITNERVDHIQLNRGSTQIIDSGAALAIPINQPVIFTTVSDLINRTLFTVALSINANNDTLNATAEFNVSVWEGDWTHLANSLEHTPPRQLVSVAEDADELEIATVGENLFDGEWENGFIVWSTGMESDADLTLQRTGWINVIGGSRIFADPANVTIGHPVRLAQFDQNKTWIRINNLPAQVRRDGFLLDPSAKFIRLSATNNHALTWLRDPLLSISYDRPIDATTLHQSTSTLIEYQDTDGTWKKPILRSINNGSEVLVADEITETEYVQRAVEVDSQLWTFELFDDVNNIVIARALNAGTGAMNANAGGLATSNRLPVINGSNNVVGSTQLAVGMPNNGNMRVGISSNEAMSGTQIRQYLIDNDYQFLVPLAEPRRFPIRMQSLSSFDPVTNIQMSTGAVQPRFNFKIAQSLSERLSLVENKVRELWMMKNKPVEYFSEAVNDLLGFMLDDMSESKKKKFEEYKRKREGSELDELDS